MTSTPGQQPRTLVAWNPRAGNAGNAAEAFAFLRAQPAVDIVETESHEHLRALAGRATSDGYQRLVMAGGDGTVNDAVTGIAEQGLSDAPELAILPIGTANDFAFTLAMPDDYLVAAARCLTGVPRAIDLVSCQVGEAERYFLNIAAGGNSDAVTRSLTPEMKARWGAWVYLRGAMQVMGDLTSFHVSIRFEHSQVPFEVDLWNLLIANGRTNAGHLPVAPRANPEDGLLDVIMIRDGSVSDLLGLTSRFLLQDYLASEQVIFRQVRSLELTSSPPLPFSLDGERTEISPSVVRCLPAALSMIVGANYQPSTQKSS
ncbi:diacylglycerol/lipid kinase family protein [Planctomycetaceae bacterium SH139]